MSTDNLLDQRSNTHGDFSNVATVSQAIKTAISMNSAAKYDELSLVQRESLEAIAGKMARIVCGNPNEPDHWVDIQGYARLAETRISK